MSQTVYTGYPEYSLPVTLTETTGQDISADTVMVGLGTFTTPPASWSAPDMISHPTDSSVTVQMLVQNITAGTYWVWTKIADDPETVPQRANFRIVVVDGTS